MTLLGRNGMGKTTTVRSIMGIAPAEGRASRSKASRWRAALRTAIAQAGPRLWCPRAARSFPTSPCARTSSPRRQPRGAKPWTLERVFDLFPHLEERRRQLRQPAFRRRAADARHRPGADDQPAPLILDEATEGLAPLVRAEIYRSIERLKAEGFDPGHRQGRQGAHARCRPPLRARERPRGVERNLGRASANPDVQHRYLRGIESFASDRRTSKHVHPQRLVRRRLGRRDRRRQAARPHASATNPSCCSATRRQGRGAARHAAATAARRCTWARSSRKACNAATTA